MKNALIRVLKISLIILAFILVILLVFGVVLSLDWPWWVGLFLLLILIGLGMAFLFFRKVWLKRREEQFVQQIIDQDESHLKILAGKEKDDLKDLQNRWKEAIEALRRSHLRKYGNPLYVLPWYMVIGESGSGKTTALQSARLSSPFAEVSRTSGVSGTRNCDWYFFEQAIIIDTAGRYAIPIDEGKDKEEWQKFLTLLLKYRRKEPIHGLIVTIAANKLLEAPQESLEEEGKNIRRRVDELMRVLGAKFPVYVLVTKCDLIKGMTQYCDQLPEKCVDQSMGFLNRDLSTDMATLQENAINTLGERLRNHRLLLLHESKTREVDPGLLLFPEEFENLRKGLASFLKGAFVENPYQETPLLRGLYFSSGCQEGTPYSHFLKSLGLIGEKEVLPGTNKGLFLHDFFSKVLPKDKGLLAPTKRALEWKALTRHLGFTSWVVLGIALAGLLSFSFVKNLRTIREVSHEFTMKSTFLRGETPSDLNAMDRFRQAILEMERQNRNWIVPRFGLNESIKVERGLKGKYCKEFQDGFLTPLDKRMSGALASFASSTPDDVIGQYVAHLVRRINILKACLEGKGFEVLLSKPQPSYFSTLSKGEEEISPEIRKKFGELYLYYLIWRLDPGDLKQEISALQAWLKQILSLRRNNLQWIIAWVNNQGNFPSITLEEFWGKGGSGSDEKSIGPAFTRKGKELMDSFLREIELALPDPLILAQPKTEFEKGYRTLCFDTWYQFGTVFPKGIERLHGKQEWQQMTTRIATDQGPYFALINKMSLELEPLLKGGGLPSWVQQTYQFQLAKAQAIAESALKDKGTFGKAAEEAKKLLVTVEKTFDKGSGENLESQLSAAKVCQEYQSALSTIVSGSSSRNQAYQMASQAFGEDPATSKSPFFIAHGAATRIGNIFSKTKPAEEVFWKLIAGPMEFLWTYVRMEAACYLQNQWEEKVLAEIQGTTGPQSMQLLLGPEGHAWKFIRGPAAPFVTRGLQRGYYAKEVLGGMIPFEASLFSFLMKGSQTTSFAKQNYPVVIKGLPTDANADAKIKPHSTRLELQCSGSGQSLANYHYPVSKTFHWSPETCNDVLFQMEVGNVLLTKKYTGQHAFPEFLQDFRGGQHTFYPQEFPVERDSLEQMAIKFIRANYQFSGDQPILEQMGSLPRQAPRNITRCWEQ